MRASVLGLTAFLVCAGCDGDPIVPDAGIDGGEVGLGPHGCQM